MSWEQKLISKNDNEELSPAQNTDLAKEIRKLVLKSMGSKETEIRVRFEDERDDIIVAPWYTNSGLKFIATLLFFLNILVLVFLVICRGIVDSANYIVHKY